MRLTTRVQPLPADHFQGPITAWLPIRNSSPRKSNQAGKAQPSRSPCWILLRPDPQAQDDRLGLAAVDPEGPAEPRRAVPVLVLSNRTKCGPTSPPSASSTASRALYHPSGRPILVRVGFHVVERRGTRDARSGNPGRQAGPPARPQVPATTISDPHYPRIGLTRRPHHDSSPDVRDSRPGLLAILDSANGCPTNDIRSWVLGSFLLAIPGLGPGLGRLPLSPAGHRNEQRRLELPAGQSCRRASRQR